VVFNHTTSTDTTITFTWNTLDYEDGVYILEVRAWDTSGNLGTSPSLMVNVKNNEEPPPEDRTPPVVSWVSPEPGTEVDGVVELQFDALDNIGIDNIKVYVNGALPSGFTLSGQDNEARYSVLWHTQDYVDGVYGIEVRALDAAGNIGSAPAVSFTVLNHPPREPRVIWVPDDYETIQCAINASDDGDTVRVRAGTYYEGIRLMGKQIWLESEEGQEVTIISSAEFQDAIRCTDGEDERTNIRGFKLMGRWNGVQSNNSSPIVYNCIISAENAGIVLGNSNAQVYNCIFIDCYTGVNGAYTWGIVRNSMFINCYVGIYEYATNFSPLDYGWDLFWQNDSSDYLSDYEPHPQDIFSDPLFKEGSYQLSNNSPAIDSGDPLILDIDGTRSDIGVYGGPYAYPPQ
jgi:hypothetical protein